MLKWLWLSTLLGITKNIKSKEIIYYICQVVATRQKVT